MLWIRFIHHAVAGRHGALFRTALNLTRHPAPEGSVVLEAVLAKVQRVGVLGHDPGLSSSIRPSSGRCSSPVNRLDLVEAAPGQGCALRASDRTDLHPDAAHLNGELECPGVRGQIVRGPPDGLQAGLVVTVQDSARSAGSSTGARSGRWHT